MLPVVTPSSWIQSLDLPSRVFPRGFDTLSEGVELYEEDGEFVLTCDTPGFERDEISLNWDDGLLYLSAEREEENRSRSVNRTFRFPKEVDADEIDARYHNGVLEVRLPIVSEGALPGRKIDVEG